MSFWLYIAVSAAGGLLVGVLGTGSSLLLLPVLALVFGVTLPEYDTLRLAAGTTMATIAVGAIAGATAQYRAGQLDIGLFRMTLLPYALGSLSGPWISRLLDTRLLALYLAGILIVIALRMLISKPSATPAARDYREHRLEAFGVLLAIGLASSVAGVASGIFAIPYLSRFSLPLRRIIGTSTASAAVYASFGAIGYVSAGWSAPNLPEGHLGFVYLPAFAIMATTALIVTPLGVRLARYVNESILRRLFALFLLAAAAAVYLSA